MVCYLFYVLLILFFCVSYIFKRLLATFFPRIDPQALLLAMRCRAMRLGTIFLKAEPVEFIFSEERREFVGFGLDQYRPTNALTVCIEVNESY